MKLLIFILMVLLLPGCDNGADHSNNIVDASDDSDVDIIDVTDDGDVKDIVEDVVIPLEDCTDDGTSLPDTDRCQHPIVVDPYAYGVQYPYVFFIQPEAIDTDFGFYKFNVIDKSIKRIGITHGRSGFYYLAVVPETKSVYWIANNIYDHNNPDAPTTSILYKVNYETDEMEDITANYPTLRSPLCVANDGRPGLHYFNPELNTLLISCDYTSTEPQSSSNIDIYLLNGDTGHIDYLVDGMDSYNTPIPQQPSNLNHGIFNFWANIWADQWTPGDTTIGYYWKVDTLTPEKILEIDFIPGVSIGGAQFSSDGWAYYGELVDGWERTKGVNIDGNTIDAPDTGYHQHAQTPISEKWVSIVGWGRCIQQEITSVQGRLNPGQCHNYILWDKETGVIRTAAWDNTVSLYGIATGMNGDPDGRFLIYLAIAGNSQVLFYKDLFSAKIIDKTGHLIEGL